MFSRTDLGLGLLLVGGVAVAVTAGLRGPKVTVEGQQPSTFLTGPDGSKALYDVLARLGRPQERRRRGLFDLTRDSLHRPGLLVVLGPSLRLEPAELEEVVAYVRGGGAVLAAGFGGGIADCFGWESRDSWRADRPDSLAVTPPDSGLRLPRVVRYLKTREATPDDTTPRWRAITELRKEGGCSALTPTGGDVLLSTAFLRRPVIVRLRFRGGGEVVLAADPGYFRNRAWRDSDVPLALTPLLIRRGRVTWDEYHHGYGSETSTMGAVLGWLAHSPGGWAILQVLAAMLVGLAVAGVRFGPALGVIERRRRSQVEHLEALAAGLEGSAGVETAVGLIVSGLRRRLSRAGLASPRGDPRQWLLALELACPTPRGRTAVRRLQDVTSHPGGPERVLAAAQAVEDVWQELRPRTTPVAF